MKYKSEAWPLLYKLIPLYLLLSKPKTLHINEVCKYLYTSNLTRDTIELLIPAISLPIINILIEFENHPEKNEDPQLLSLIKRPDIHMNECNPDNISGNLHNLLDITLPSYMPTESDTSGYSIIESLSELYFPTDKRVTEVCELLKYINYIIVHQKN